MVLGSCFPASPPMISVVPTPASTITSNVLILIRLVHHNGPTGSLAESIAVIRRLRKLALSLRPSLAPRTGGPGLTSKPVLWCMVGGVGIFPSRIAIPLVSLTRFSTALYYQRLPFNPAA